MTDKNLSLRRALAVALVFAMIASAVFVLVPGDSKASGEGWLDGWQYRKSHVIAATTGAGDGYQVGVKVYNGTGTDGTETVYGIEFGKVYISSITNDFRDIRFTASDGVTLLPYWIETYASNSNAVIWVSVTGGLVSGATIYIYWGNPSAISASNGDATFEFFDGFDGGSVWTRQGLVIPTPSTDWTYAEPSVIVEGDSKLLGLDPSVQVLKLWYRAYQTSTQNCTIRYAESADGTTWTVRSTPVLDTGELTFCPFVFKYDGQFYMYVHAGWHYIDRWVSSDGISWTKDQDNTLVLGASGAWNDWNLGNLFVWVEDGAWYCILEGAPDNTIWHLGLMTSSDGKTWTNYEGNPVIGSINGGGPCVEKIGGTYWMWFQGPTGLPTDIMRASSTDLHTWTLSNGGKPVITRTEEYEGVGQSEGQLGDVSFGRFNGKIYNYYEAVHTQSDHRGIALMITDLTLNELVQTNENAEKGQLDASKWAGATASVSINSGVLTQTESAGSWAKLYSTYSAGQGHSVVYKATMATPSSSSVGNVMGWADAPAGGQTFVDVTKMTSHLMRSQNAGSGYITKTLSLDQSQHRWEIERRSASSVFLLDGTVKATITETVPTADLNVVFQTIRATLYCDYVFVRQLADAEPTHSTWGTSEELVAPLAITSSANVNGYVGLAYQYQAAANRAVGTWSISGASFLSISPSGLVTGTPGAGDVGTYSVTVTAQKDTETVHQTYSLTVSAPISSAPPGTGKEGVAYEYQVVCLPTVNSWSISGASFLSISPSGLVSGTPGNNDAGTYTVTITATTAYGSATQTYELVIAESTTWAITSAPKTTGVAGLVYSYAPICNGTVTAWTLSGNATFLTIDQATGLVTGTPTQAGTYAVTITANTDPECAQTYELVISALDWQVTVTVKATVTDLKVSVSYALSDPSLAWAVASISWDFGDGSMAQSGSTASHTYAKAGTYTVTCTVVNVLDNSTSGTKSITVKKASTPTTVIPGGSGGSGSGSGSGTSGKGSSLLIAVIGLPLLLILIVVALSEGQKQSHNRRRRR